MFRLLLQTTAVLALALPATAQDAEVGEEYEITIETEEENQYVGMYGQARIGSVVVNIPNARVEERYSVTITDIRENQYSGDRQAACEFEQECVYCPRVLGQWFDGIRFYAAASSPRRSRRTWAGLR